MRSTLFAHVSWSLLQVERTVWVFTCHDLPNNLLPGVQSIVNQLTLVFNTLSEDGWWCLLLLVHVLIFVGILWLNGAHLRRFTFICVSVLTLRRQELLPKINLRWLFDLCILSRRCSRRWSLRYSLCRIMRAYLIEMPMPNIIEKAPNYIAVSIHEMPLTPKVAWTEFGEASKVLKHFIEVG